MAQALDKTWMRYVAFGEGLRVSAFALIGIGAALTLAWFMSSLIYSSRMQLNQSNRTQMLDFVRIKRNEAAQRKDRKPERPQVNKVPDAPPAESSNVGDQLTISVSAGSTVTADLDLDVGITTGDGDYLPIVKVPPVYPQSALARDLTGQCTVRYTVTTAGTVKDVEVVEDQCTSSVFRRSSVEAAKRFKYKPRVIDGVAIEVQGVMNRFYFELEGAEGKVDQ